MIVEFVTFNAPAGWDRAQILEDARHTVPRWSANRDLLRKHFVRGLGTDEGTLGGVYVWPSIEAAQAAHNAEWWAGIVKRTGGEPTIRYFDLFLLIDNENQAVTEFASDGTPRSLDRT